MEEEGRGEREGELRAMGEGCFGAEGLVVSLPSCIYESFGFLSSLAPDGRIWIWISP